MFRLFLFSHARSFTDTERTRGTNKAIKRETERRTTKKAGRAESSGAGHPKVTRAERRRASQAHRRHEVAWQRQTLPGRRAEEGDLGSGKGTTRIYSAQEPRAWSASRVEEEKWAKPNRVRFRFVNATHVGQRKWINLGSSKVNYSKLLSFLSSIHCLISLQSELHPECRLQRQHFTDNTSQCRTWTWRWFKETRHLSEWIRPATWR